MPSPNPSLAAEIEKDAAEFVRSSREFFGVDLDFSEASLTALDELISRVYPNGNAMETTLIPFGSYIGETVRHNLGGTWEDAGDHGAGLANIGGVDLRVFPFTWARKRFANGEKDSIAFKFKVVKSEAEKARGTPFAPVAPRPYVPPAPSRTATEEELQRLARAPLLVLFMVAGADGKISKKELGAFDKAVENFAPETSPLLTQAMGWLMENLQAYMEQLQSPEIDPLQDFKLLGQTLRECYPAEADGFKNGLLTLGTDIAQASGGFLGFGSKVSKEEMAALAMISLAIDGRELPR